MDDLPLVLGEESIMAVFSKCKSQTSKRENRPPVGWLTVYNLVRFVSRWMIYPWF